MLPYPPSRECRHQRHVHACERPETAYTFSPFGEGVMRWKECSVMDESMQFVARRLTGEAMAELCREFGISRKTGYKIFDRYQE